MRTLKLSHLFQLNPRNQLSTAFDGIANLWDATTGECLRSIADHKRAAYTLCFSPEGKFFATGSGDGWLYIYNVAVGHLLKYILVAKLTTSRKTTERVWSWHPGTASPGIYEIDWKQNSQINRIAMCLENRTVGVIDVNRIPALMA